MHIGEEQAGRPEAGPGGAGRHPRVLLVGYNGANNTGSESLLLADIEDVRAVLGPDAHITVPTLNEQNLRRYLKEGPHLTIEPIPSIYFGALRRLVKGHDLVMIVEGSAYMDTWTSALLWAFLWATRCARRYGRPCLAYAVDAGELSPANRRRVRREASKTDLIVARTRAAKERLEAIGVTAPMAVSADNAFSFAMDPADAGFLRREWPDAGPRVAGMAVVDFYRWPVVIRPWGRAEDLYKWPYYFSRSKARREQSEALATDLADVADHIVEEHGMGVALLCMEQLDEPLARRVHGLMSYKDRARVFSSREHTASRMTAVLRDLELLVTSRYHAAVLSLASPVPMVALGHDLRLRTLFGDLGIADRLFIEHCSADRCGNVKTIVDSLATDPAPEREVLRKGYEGHMARARRNRELLREFVRGKGWEVRG